MTMNRTTATRLAILILVALATRLPVFGNPIVHVDESFYLVVARAMTQGALPFVDIWDRKPIGLFLLYLPAAALPFAWSIYAYQAMALVAALATAFLIARLADRVGWNRGATFAGAAYLLWLVPLGGVGGQAPVFFNLPMAGAATLILIGRGDRRYGLAAMALVGVSLQIKYSVVFEGIFFGVWLLSNDWHARRSVAAVAGYAAALIALALLPTLAAYAFYAVAGHGEAFVFANFSSILGRRSDPWSERLGNAATLTLILSPLLAMAFVRSRSAAVEDRGERLFLRYWFAASLLGIALFGTWFDHYGLPALVPGCACAAGFFEAARRSWGYVVLAIVASAGAITVYVNCANRGTPAQFAALVTAVGRGPGCLWVQSGETMLHAATDRCTSSRFVFPSHLGRNREHAAIGADQASEIDQILASKPAVIVMRGAYRGERPEIRAHVLRAIRTDYRRSGEVILGKNRVTVYKLSARADR
jgi:hypothetical protein